MSAVKNKKRKHSGEAVEVAPEEPDDELNWSDEEGTVVDGIHIPAPAKRNVSATSNARLIIRKISNNFFKSYAQETDLGPFSVCFNAIVGPNGSGKSNVIDSMLFVFGYRATRIRCKKLSVLLHNSEKYRSVPSCTVAVHFCQIIDKPGNEYEIVPNSEFVVARTANKDNSSYYELNGRRVQFKEIAKLLRHHGIDLDHNRFLILQGEVEEIAMMKSKGANDSETGMLEYLEDIIGTNRYKKPLVELNDRIENLSVLRTEKLNRLMLIEKKLDELKGPMDEAIVFLKTENTIATCKNFLYQRNVFKLEEKVKEIKEDKAQISQSRNNIIESLKEIAKQKGEKEDTLRQKSLKYDKLTRKKDQLKEAFNAADKKDVQLQAEMVQTNNNRKKYKQQLEDERKKLAQLQNVPDENKKTIVECETKAVQLTSEKEKLEAQKTKLLANIRAETEDLQKEKERLETGLGQLKKAVHETKSAYDLANAELKLALSQEETEQNRLQQLREMITDISEKIAQRTEEVAQLRRKIPLTEKSLNDAQRELDNVKRETVQVSREVGQKRISLQETKTSMQMSKSRGKVLDALMQQKRQGNCPGLYGRLGDLGAIDQKYDVAVSTACGPLDNIVVDCANTAQWCIEFLKQHGIGRATFIALDKQEYLRELASTRIQTPENVHRLFDLIKIPDETVRTAFYFALRDTLVADDLEQATRIAYGARRYRVVTLKGDLIETSGTMSGGGKTVSRGRMGQSVVVTNINPKEIQKMETHLGQCEDRLVELTQKQATLESQINTLLPELNMMKLNLQKFNEVLQSLKQQQPVLQQKFKNQENVVKATKSDAKQIQRLTVIVEEEKDAFEEASAAAQEIQSKVDRLTEKIREKTTGKMRAVDKSLNEVSKSIDKCKAEITRLRVATTASERNAKKSAQKITTFEQNIVDAENRLRAMKEERETIESDGRKLLQCIEEMAEQLENGEGEYAELKNEVKALTAEEKKLLLKQVDVDQTFKSINEKLNECNSASHQWTAKLAQLKLHDIPEDSSELKTFTPEELQSKNPEVVELELQAAQNNIKNTKPNLNVIQEYRTGQNNYMEKAKELETITTKRNDMKTLHDKVKNQRRDEFLVGYNIIRMKLKEMYQMITLGGDADFEILDSCDPFADGVQLNVRPPRKSWKAISNLSGGEKTLSSLALVFALHYYKPSPLYVMDEIDAALDFKNVSIVGHYIKERTKNAQFIIISLRSNMFELCDNLIGIYKIFNCTKSITIDPRGFDDKKQEPEKEVAVQRHVPESQEPVARVVQNEDAVVNDSLEDAMDVS
ncbi:hypothetical protein Zmor_004654 [Zophobas morio]|uniref:Structural maintenance of chromosomes protein n=1 Tax=Zophobas morio TaxID=2755281 RepID=A0AA38MLI5_9CUCU|nr:hypothetical protein Zmor_004654 [Zophobas morio]